MTESKAATAWANLQAALDLSDPACLGDPRFTAETSDDDGALTKLCAECPVREQCLAWGLAAPTAQRFGFFAGISRRGHKSRPRGAGAPAVTAEQVERIGQLRAEGRTVQAIADELGLGATTVQRRLRLLSEAS